MILMLIQSDYLALFRCNKINMVRLYRNVFCRVVSCNFSNNETYLQCTRRQNLFVSSVLYTFSRRSVGQGCTTPDSSADYRRNFRRPMGVALAGWDHGGGPADLWGYPNPVRHRPNSGPLSNGQEVPYI